MIVPIALQVFALIAASYFLSFQIMRSLAVVSGPYFILRLLLLPGVILHESAHALACFFTGTPIENISFWTESGGQVVHHKPRLSLIAQPIISLAPFPAGIAGLVYLSHLITLARWSVRIFLVWLMVSIAATLAPSKTDMIHAAEGALASLIIGIIVYHFFPAAENRMNPRLIQFSHQLQLIVILLGVTWFLLLCLHSLLYAKPRR